MASGVRVKRLSDPISKEDGAAFLLDVGGTKAPLATGVRSLATLRPTSEIAGLDRGSASAYRKFRGLYWRQLGTRTNVEELAKLRQLGGRSAGVTLLTNERRAEWSAAMAVAELLDGQNQ